MGVGFRAETVSLTTPRPGPTKVSEGCGGVEGRRWDAWTQGSGRPVSGLRTHDPAETLKHFYLN